MSTKSGLLADLRRAYDALAYANLSEHMPQHKAQALDRAIGSESAPPPRSHPRVALAVQGEIHRSALRYASGACQRMDADLDIVTDCAEGGLPDVVDPEWQRLSAAGHRVEVISLGRDLLRGVVRYAAARSGLLFVIVSADDAVAERVISGIGDADRLDVPWVVVAEATPA